MARAISAPHLFVGLVITFVVLMLVFSLLEPVMSGLINSPLFEPHTEMGADGKRMVEGTWAYFFVPFLVAIFYAAVSNSRRET